MSQIDFKLASFWEDTEEGTDYLINDWRFAHRQRHISVLKYGQISIRYQTKWGNETEYHKLLDGRFKALVYLFEFTDAMVVCRVVDIKDCLLNHQYEIVNNSDGSKGCYIKLNNILHLTIWKK